MEGIVSSMDSIQALRALSFPPMVEFPREGYVHMAVLFSALAFCFWGWRKKYVKSLFLLSSSSCFSLKFNRSCHQTHITRVPAVSFAVDHVKKPAKQNESGKTGKFYMRFECSIQSPENEFCQKSEANGAVSRDNSVTLFSFSSEEKTLDSVHFRDHGNLDVPSPVIVNCFDVSWRREVLGSSRVDSNNTVRLWDIPTSRCVNCMKLHETSVIAGAPNWNSPHLYLVSDISKAEEKCRLYVWDTRNFPKPLSFFLGKNWRVDIVEFNDKKVYVCDDLSERMFDLRMAGARAVEVN